MKVFAMLTLASAAYAISDQQACSNKRYGKKTVQAIQNFCAKTNMVAPSSYAQKGATVGGQKVGIDSKS